MQDPFKRALTRRRVHRGRSFVVEPSPVVVLGVKFAVAMIFVLVFLQVFHVLWFGVWSHEVFNAISGLIGSVAGVLVGSHA